jgi:hypothetical protein
MSIMAEIFSGLASMPRSNTTKPRSIPLETQKRTSQGSARPRAVVASEDLNEVGNQIPRFLRLDYNVVDVRFL